MSIVAAFVGFGFKRMQDPDMIFSWYGEWLNYLSGNPFRTLRSKIFLFKFWWNTLRPYSKRFKFDYSKDKFAMHPVPVYKQSKFLYYFTKPLGRCIICNTVWIGMLLTFILFPMQHLIVFDIITVGVASAGIVVLISNKYELMQNAL